MSFPSEFILPVSTVHAEDDDFTLTGKLTVADTAVASSMLSRVSLKAVSSARAIGCTRDTPGKMLGTNFAGPASVVGKSRCMLSVDALD